jgi:hypothetical protein
MRQRPLRAHLPLLQPTTVFRNVAFIGSGKLSILPRSFYNQTVTRSKYPPPQLNTSSLFNAFHMYQEFVKEVLDFYGIAGGAGQPASAVAAAAIVDLEALLSSTVNFCGLDMQPMFSNVLHRCLLVCVQMCPRCCLSLILLPLHPIFHGPSAYCQPLTLHSCCRRRWSCESGKPFFNFSTTLCCSESGP